MKLDNISFPYPVLGNSDDISPGPEIKEPELHVDNNNFVFKLAFKLNNHDIESLIEAGKAAYFCEADCVSTLYRRSFFSREPNFEITIPRKAVGKKLTIICRVVAQENITGYKNSNSHPDYNGFSFLIEQGEVLAILGQLEYNIDINYDKLRCVDSIIQILPVDCVTLWYDLNNDKIIIKLPRGQYERYRTSIARNKMWAPILHASLLLNAVTYALANYKDFKEFRWARALRYRMKTEKQFSGFDIEDMSSQDVLTVAQLLLGNPISNLFNMEFMLEEED